MKRVISRLVRSISSNTIPDPTGNFDSTQALQKAIDTGKSVFLEEGEYKVNNLKLTTAGQQIVGLGNVRLVKNDHGPIITVSGMGAILSNIKFSGDSSNPKFVGDNIFVTGNYVSLVNCGSRWAHGRAVKCVGSQFNIYGSNDIYQTSDISDDGYDIELGDGVNTCYYSKIIGINSTQATGGIWLRSPGVTSIMGCQFGKFNIDPGISPSGMHGPMVSGCRINGHTTIGVSSSMFASTSVSADVTITGAVTSVMLGDTFMMASGKTLTIGANCNCSTMNLSALEGLGVKIVGEGARNSISRFGSSYTPKWTGSISDPQIGNGTIDAHYTREGRTISASVTMLMGSSTTYGSGYWRISLPFTSMPVNAKSVGNLYMLDSGTNFRVGSVVIEGGADSAILIAESSSNAVGPFIPFEWSAGDTLAFTVTYPAA